ncbi:MAG: SUMF1/EgtB/PvdO family nonheme iron enzyme, partial [Alphaproteobacteria bacterium]
EQPTPARCISGFEAQTYCEAQGMRLPTPEEWDANLTPLPATPGQVGGGPPGEQAA